MAARDFVGVQTFGRFCVGIRNISKTFTDFNDIHLAYRKYLVKAKENIHGDDDVTFIDSLIELCDKGILPICSERGYYADEQNYSREYYCFLFDCRSVPTINREFKLDERFAEYIIDAQTEVVMRKREAEAKSAIIELRGPADKQKRPISELQKLAEYNFKEERKITAISLSRDHDYYNCMLLRYPLEEMKDLPPKLFELITRDYVVIHICDLEVGRNVRLRQYLSSLLDKINEWKN